MKKSILAFACISAVAPSVFAQSVVDALQVSQSDFKGTARYMSMGGAFTALGGDLSAIGLNPGGIGVYRRSEIGATLDIDMQKSKGVTQGVTAKNTQTKAYCNNFGYIGSVLLNGALKNFNWGVTYNRLASFDRVTGGYAPSAGTSLTNYVAAFTDGIPGKDMDFTDSYNPYGSGIDWLSILSYSSFMINPTGPDSYQGLYFPAADGYPETTSDSEIYVHEKGHVDNYEFTFGGNFSDIIYWGLGIGINDLRYVREVSYSESMENAEVYDPDTKGTANGAAGYYLDNYKEITGTGYNFSFGIIAKPIQELRIGASIMTPTWYTFDHSYQGRTSFTYTPDYDVNARTEGNDYSDNAYFNWKLKSPWRFNVGVAAVIGSSAIVSVDYERKAYNDMSVKYGDYDNYGYLMGYTDAQPVNQELKTISQGSNTIRVGAEYRITPQLSVRAGYNVETSNIKNAYKDGYKEISTSGTDPSFSLDKTTQYVSVGLGYRFGNWYIDGTYVHKNRKSNLKPYTSWGGAENLAMALTQSPSFDVTDNNNSLVFSLGFKF